jgi:uncharacterized membrane protein
VIVLGIILLIIGLLAAIPILVTIGVILIVIGLVLELLGWPVMRWAAGATTTEGWAHPRHCYQETRP